MSEKTATGPPPDNPRDLDAAQPPCRVCGKPSTNWAQHLYRDASPWHGDHLVHYSVVEGSGHFGCDEHPAESHEFDISTLWPTKEAP